MLLSFPPLQSMSTVDSVCSQCTKDVDDSVGLMYFDTTYKLMFLIGYVEHLQKYYWLHEILKKAILSLTLPSWTLNGCKYLQVCQGKSEGSHSQEMSKCV